MNLFFLLLLVLFIILVFMYIYPDKIFGKMPYKDSTVFIEKEEDHTLVPIYMTKYIIGGRMGVNIFVDGIKVANIKPGDTISVPVMPGMRKVSAYCLEEDKNEIDVNVDEDTALFVYAEYAGEGIPATPSIKQLKKDDPIDESYSEKEYQKALVERKSGRLSALMTLLVFGIPIWAYLISKL